jgi:hypothetical protein
MEESDDAAMTRFEEAPPDHHPLVTEVGRCKLDPWNPC